MTTSATPPEPRDGNHHGRRFGPPFPRGTRPPWWPENEPWPPRRGEPRRWLWRMAALFLLLFLLFLGFGALAFWAGQYFAPEAEHMPGPVMSWMMRNMSLGWVLSRVVLGGALVALFIFSVGAVARHLVRTARPVDEVMQAAQRVAAGDYSVRVAESGARETRDLARTFNAMTAQLGANDEQRRRLLADVTHELRTPLTIIQGELEAVLDGVHPADSSHLGAILDETRVMSRLIDDLRTLALAESGALRLMREPVDLGVLAGEAIAGFQTQAASSGVALEVDAPAELPLADLDPLRLREVLTNLIANALRYTQPGGRVTIGLGSESDRLVVTVSDTGAGIPAERLPHVFDRFYKSEESHGSGLGLAIAKSLVEAHNGKLEVASTIGVGTTFTIRLPLSENAA